MDTSIGKRIERLLESKNGGNQSELARFVGVSPQAVQQWIADETSPRGRNLAMAAEYLGTTPAELRFGGPHPISVAMGVGETISRLGELLTPADESTRAAVADLLMRYAKDPQAGDRLAMAIKILLDAQEERR